MAEATTPGISDHSVSGDLSDDVMTYLARGVPHNRYHDLGIKMGFNRTWVNNLEYKYQRDVEKAARDLFMAWTTEHGDGPEQRVKLEKILASAGLRSLADSLIVPDVTSSNQHTDPDVYAKKITDKLTVGMCRNKLIHRYKTRTCKVQIKPWDRSSVAEVKDIFTLVTMYKKDLDGKNLGEHEKVTLQGSVNDIFTTKVNGMLPYRIVIFAGAGKGKTTSVAKMAYDWAYSIQGSPLQDLPLLFILRLRDIQPQTSLGQAITSELLNDIQDLTPEALETFIRENQKLCWLILDGLDEYSGSIRGDSTLNSNIVRVLTNLDLPECRVLVTSRPHLEKDFDQGDIPIIYARMEIKGFSRLNSRAYIDRFFIGDTKGNDLKAYLDRNDVINELVSTPLFCLMVCYLWREDLLSNLDTQTGLLDSVNSFLLRHAQRRSAEFTKAVLDKTLIQLGQVALDGLLNDRNKLVFAIDDFANVPGAIDIGCELGLISKTTTREFKPTLHEQPLVTIEFYHKLAQEHTAGKYLAESFNTIWSWFRSSTLDWVLYQISSNIADYEHLLRFTAGTTDYVCMRVMKEVLTMTSVSESERFRILLDCSTESGELKEEVSSMVQGCVRNGKVVLKSPTVYTAVGMKKIPDQLKEQITSVEIQTPHLDTTLSRTLSIGLQSLPRIQLLTITNPVVTQRLPHVTSITSLKLHSVPPGCDDWEWLREVHNLEVIHVTVSSDDGVDEGPLRYRPQPSLFLCDGNFKICNATSVLLKAFQYLPERMLTNVKSTTVSFTDLNADLSRRLWESLRSSTQLECLKVIDSIMSRELPHIKYSKYVKFEYLPLGCDGWEWLGGVRDLEELDVTFAQPDNLGRSLPLGKSSEYIIVQESNNNDDTWGGGDADVLLKELATNGTCKAEEELAHHDISLLAPERLHVKGHEAVFYNVSADSVEVFRNLPQEFHRKIRQVTIRSSDLTETVSPIMSEGIMVVPELQYLTVLEPTSVSRLPHHTAIRCLRLEDLPRGCEDWAWLKEVRGMEEMFATVHENYQLGDSAEKADDETRSLEDKESLKLQGGSLGIMKMSNCTLSMLENLPVENLSKIRTVEVSTDGLTGNIPERLGNALHLCSSLDRLGLTVTQTTDSTGYLRMNAGHVDLTSASEEHVPILQGLIKATPSKIRVVEIRAANMPDTMAARIVECLSVCLRLNELHVFVGKGTNEGEVLSVVHEKVKLNSTSDAMVAIFTGLDQRILAQLKNIEITVKHLTPHITESLETTLSQCSILDRLEVTIGQGAAALKYQRMTLELMSVSKELLSIVQGLTKVAFKKIRNVTVTGADLAVSSADKLGKCLQDCSVIHLLEVNVGKGSDHMETLTVFHKGAEIKMSSGALVAILSGLNKKVLGEFKKLLVTAERMSTSTAENLSTVLQSCIGLSEVQVNHMAVSCSGSGRSGSLSVIYGQAKLTSATRELCIILAGLASVVPGKMKVLRIQYSNLDQDEWSRLWETLATSSSIERLGIEESSITVPHPCPALESVQYLSAKRLTPATHSCLIPSLPALTEIAVELKDDASEAISILSDSIKKGGQLLKSISLSGISANQRVSEDAMGKLCETVRDMTTSLEVINLSSLGVSEDALITIIDSCRDLLAIKAIKFLWCGPVEGDRLHTHFVNLHNPEGTIMAEVINEGCFLESKFFPKSHCAITTGKPDSDATCSQ